jgi:hypothetical protein
VGQTPNLLAKPKEPAGRRSGAAFLWLPFFSRIKKVTRLPGGHGTQSTMRKRIQTLQRACDVKKPTSIAPHMVNMGLGALR